MWSCSPQTRITGTAAAAAGQIRRDPGCLARPVGQAGPHVGGRAEAVQQQDRR
jgi:hypothetical protein